VSWLGVGLDPFSERNNADKEYFRIEGSNAYLIVKQWPDKDNNKESS